MEAPAVNLLIARLTVTGALGGDRNPFSYCSLTTMKRLAAVMTLIARLTNYGVSGDG